MNPVIKTGKPTVLLAVIALLAVITAAPAAAQSARGAVNPRLRLLALRAANHHGWNALRRYARFAPDSETRGLAYFALGYREYEARLYEPAAGDLLRAAQSGCSLAGFAEYYEAVTDRLLNRNANAVAVLENFSSRYPHSRLCLQAVNLLAGLLIQGGHPQRALQTLRAEPQALRHPSSLLLLAKACAAAQNLVEAAKTDQQVFYGFPTAPEAHEAKAQLMNLQLSLGSQFPEVSDGIKNERAKTLFNHSNLREALAEYVNLLLSEPKSPFRFEWQLGRARCLLGLGRTSDAIEALKTPVRESPLAESERLALLVYANDRAENESSMLQALEELYKSDPHSPFYARALAFAGGYFARHGFWQTAAQYYQPLTQAFPGNPYAEEATWRVAWYGVLAGKMNQAQVALLAYLKNYPSGPRLPAALYWLGWIQERDGSLAEAAAIEKDLAHRFANSYYGLKAHGFASGLSRFSGELKSAPSHPVSSPLDFLLTLPSLSPPALKPCGLVPAEPLITPAAMLASLNLKTLAEDYVRKLAGSRHPDDPQFFFALANFQSAQGSVSAALFAAKRAVPNYENYSFDALPKEVWDMLYPRSYWPVVRRYARASRLDPYLVMGLIRQESAFNPRATSSAGARGLMQMMPQTIERGVRGRWRRRRVVRSLYSPAYNIRASCRYLRDLLRIFGGNEAQALAAYNAGDTRVKQWLANGGLRDPAMFPESIPFVDTRAYVESILRDAVIYRALLTGTAKFSRCESSGKNRLALYRLGPE